MREKNRSRDLNYVMREKNRCFLWRYYLAIEFKEEEKKRKAKKKEMFKYSTDIL